MDEMMIFEAYRDRDEAEREKPWEQPCWYCKHSNATECPWFQLPQKEREDWFAKRTEVSMYDPDRPETINKTAPSVHIIKCGGFDWNGIQDLDERTDDESQRLDEDVGTP